MRSILVGLNVYAAIWARRQAGEDSEHKILERVLGCVPDERPAMRDEPLQKARLAMGFHDSRHSVHFSEGFEIFRRYRGTDYRAFATEGEWKLANDGRRFRSLNDLSRGLGAISENAWVNWFYRNERGERCPVARLRDERTVNRRRMQLTNDSSDSSDSSQTHSLSETTSAVGEFEGEGDMTWKDIVLAAMRRLRDRMEINVPLNKIYREVAAVCEEIGKNMPPTAEAIVRRTLENFSSDSDAYLGRDDIFRMSEHRGAGIWALR